MAIDLQLQTAKQSAVNPTAKSGSIRGTLALLDKEGKAKQQWTIWQSKCTIGTAPECAVRCELPGIAPHHALLVIGAQQVFLRALAPKVSANGNLVSELLLSDTRTSFELAGHKFQFSRSTQIAAKEIATRAPDGAKKPIGAILPATRPNSTIENLKNHPIRFSLARTITNQADAPINQANPQNQLEPLSTPSPRVTSTHVNEPQFASNEKQSLASRQWITQAIRDAVSPLENKLQDLSIPVNWVKQEIERSKQERLRESAALAQSSTLQIADSQKAVEDLVTRQTDRLESMAERVAEIHSRIVGVEQMVSASLNHDQSEGLRASYHVQEESIKQLQERVEGVVALLRQLQDQNSTIANTDVHWKEAVTDKLAEMPEVVQRLAGSLDTLAAAVDTLQLVQHTANEQNTAWQISLQDSIASVRASTDVLVQWHSNVLLRDDFYDQIQQLAERQNHPQSVANNSLTGSQENAWNFSSPACPVNQFSQPELNPSVTHGSQQSFATNPEPLTQSIANDATVSSPMLAQVAEHVDSHPNQFNAQQQVPETPPNDAVTSVANSGSEHEPIIQQVACVLDPDPPSEQIPIWWKSEDLTQVTRPHVESRPSYSVDHVSELPAYRRLQESSTTEQESYTSQGDAYSPASDNNGFDAHDELLRTQTISPQMTSNPVSLSDTASIDDCADLAQANESEAANHFPPQPADSDYAGYSPSSTYPVNDGYSAGFSQFEQPQIPEPGTNIWEQLAPASYESTFDESAFEHGVEQQSAEEPTSMATDPAVSVDAPTEYEKELPASSHEEQVTNSINDIMARLSGSYFKEQAKDTAGESSRPTHNSLPEQSLLARFQLDEPEVENESNQRANQFDTGTLPYSAADLSPEQGEEDEPVGASNPRSISTREPLTRTEDSGENEESEESVEDYMQRLLARMRGDNSEPVKPTPKKSSEPQESARTATATKPTPTQETSKSRIEQRTTSLEERLATASLNTRTSGPISTRALGPEAIPTQPFDPEQYVPRGMAHEKPRDLAAMRELANSSARTAIQASARRRYGTAILLKLSISLVGFIAGATLLLINGLEINVSFIATIAAFLVGGIWGFDAINSIKPLLASAAQPLVDSSVSSDAPASPPENQA